jgi:hypothetical protein
VLEALAPVRSGSPPSALEADYQHLIDAAA